MIETEDVGSSVETAETTIRVTSNTDSNSPTIMNGLLDTSMADGHTVSAAEPCLTHFSWDDTIDWNNFASNYAESIPSSLAFFSSNDTSGSLLDNAYLFPTSTQLQSGHGLSLSQQKTDESKPDNPKMKGVDIDMESSPDSPRPVLAQLSRLSMHLCSLRDMTSALVNFSSSQPDDRQRSLIHDTAFKPEAAWLTHCEDFVITHMNQGSHNIDFETPELLNPNFHLAEGSSFASYLNGHPVFQSWTRLFEW